MRITDPAMVHTAPATPDASEGAQAFESYMVEMMVKEMRKTIPDGLFSGSETAMFSELFDREIADRIGASAGFGVSSLIPDSNEALRFNAPVEGHLTSDFGLRSDPFHGQERHHNGVDWGAPRGTPVRASKAGVVTRSDYSKSLGHHVEVDHGSGWTTMYAHLADRNVETGAHVTPSSLVGTVGDSGRATGPHLHFELRHHGKGVDPSDHVDGLKENVQDHHPVADGLNRSILP